MPVSVIGERSACVKRLVDEVFVGAPMKLVGPRSHGDIEKASARLPEFGRIVARLDRELLNRIDTALGLRLHGVPAISGILPIDSHGLRVGGHPVDADIDVGTVSSAGQQLNHGIGFRNPELPAAAPMPITGRLFMVFEVTVWLSSPLSVLSNGADAETVTDSVFEPTSRTTSTR